MDLIEVVQAGGPSSNHQFLGDYLEGKPPWILLNFPDKVPPALELASPNDFIAHLSDLPYLMQRGITLRAGGFPSRLHCIRYAGLTVCRSTKISSSVHAPPPTWHRVIVCCDYLPPRLAQRALHRLSGINPTKLFNEPGFLEKVSEFVLAKPSCVPGWAFPFAAPPFRVSSSQVYNTELDADYSHPGDLILKSPEMRTSLTTS